MREVIVGVATFTLGAALGFVVAKKVYEEKYKALAQEEIDDVKAHYENKAKDERKWAVSPNVDEADTDEEEYEETVRDNLRHKNPLARSSLDDNPYEQAKKNYSLISTMRDDEEEDDEPIVDSAGKTEEEMTAPAPGEPFVISSEEYSLECLEYDKLTLYYYRYDDVLCEEEDEEFDVDDIGAVVGWEVFNVLEQQMNAWVRNPRLQIDYEIVAINGYFSEAKYGEITRFETPREKYERKMREKDDI